MISFTTDRRDFETISEIADRALPVLKRAGAYDVTKQHVMMDISAVHANGCPLRLEALLVAPDFDFSHDVAGIYGNLNRETGQLENCFVPRHAVPAV